MQPGSNDHHFKNAATALRLDEAREIVRGLRAITPAVVEPATRYRKPELRELFLSGLRLAAGEAG